MQTCYWILSKHHCNTWYTSCETIRLVSIPIDLCQFLASLYIGQNSQHLSLICSNQSCIKLMIGLSSKFSGVTIKRQTRSQILATYHVAQSITVQWHLHTKKWPLSVKKYLGQSLSTLTTDRISRASTLKYNSTQKLVSFIDMIQPHVIVWGWKFLGTMTDSVLASYTVYIGHSNSEFYITGGSKG